MKRIVAFIRPSMLDDVVHALHSIEGLPGATISEVRGIGAGFRETVAGKGNHEALHAFPKSVRLEVVCRDEEAEGITKTIAQNAHTGRPDDGKIFVSSVDDAIRIRTGEQGESAV